MNSVSKIVASILLLHTAFSQAEQAQQWTLQQLCQAAHNNFLQTKNDPENKRALISLSKTFLPENFDQSSVKLSANDLAQLVAAFDCVHEFAKLRKESFFSLPRATSPVDALYSFCYFSDRYPSKDEYKDLYKYKTEYTWQETIQFMFDEHNINVGFDGTLHVLNYAGCVKEATRFNKAYAKAEYRAYYRNKSNAILFPIVAAMGVMYAASSC